MNQGLPDPHWGLPGGVASGCLPSGRRGSREVVASVLLERLASQRDVWGQECRAALYSLQRPLLGTQRYLYSDIEEETCPHLSAAVRMAPVPLGDPRNSGRAEGGDTGPALLGGRKQPSNKLFQV